jgi:CheY-like chemotaxis protein
MAERDSTLILIVEDNADTRDVLQRILVMQGYQVIGTRNGLDALAYLESGAMPAAIILDIAMPIMDGITFSQKLRADTRWAHVPVIVYTAMPTKHVATAAGLFRKGTDDPGRLLDLLAQVCGTTH